MLRPLLNKNTRIKTLRSNCWCTKPIFIHCKVLKNLFLKSYNILKIISQYNWNLQKYVLLSETDLIYLSITIGTLYNSGYQPFYIRVPTTRFNSFYVPLDHKSIIFLLIMSLNIVLHDVWKFILSYNYKFITIYKYLMDKKKNYLI